MSRASGPLTIPPQTEVELVTNSARPCFRQNDNVPEISPFAPEAARSLLAKENASPALPACLHIPSAVSSAAA